jgi:hypothetical protein
MTSALHRSNARPQRLRAKQDKAEVTRLTAYYRPWIDWTDQGILHDLKVIHDVDDPAKGLLLNIAVSVADQHQIRLGRQEKRRKDLLIGWLNEHHSYCDVASLILYQGPGCAPFAFQRIVTDEGSTAATAAEGADPKQ